MKNLQNIIIALDNKDKLDAMFYLGKSTNLMSPDSLRFVYETIKHKSMSDESINQAKITIQRWIDAQKR